MAGLTRSLYLRCLACFYEWDVVVEWGYYSTGSYGPLNWPDACPECGHRWFKDR